ncbi:opacity protein-like surface antigen [Flavobacteriaceae bacterium MAR_2009_75]|nr:opacity protein-like surface antigen [Flavobacteriaceae bacterium MAR_2009_75]
MNSKLLFCTLFLATFCLFAQDEKWSIEANYPHTLGGHESDIDALNSIIDVGVKYRFLKLGPVRLGTSISSSLFSKSENFLYGNSTANDLEFDSKFTKVLLQPRVFAELDIPVIPRLKPQVGVGYSIIFSDFQFSDGNGSSTDDYNTTGGVNLNVGLAYNFTKRFFVQIQYDYTREKGDVIYENINSMEEFNFKSNIDMLKIGVGFRF